MRLARHICCRKALCASNVECCQLGSRLICAVCFGLGAHLSVRCNVLKRAAQDAERLARAETLDLVQSLHCSLVRQVAHKRREGVRRDDAHLHDVSLHMLSCMTHFLLFPCPYDRWLSWSCVSFRSCHDRLSQPADNCMQQSWMPTRVAHPAALDALDSGVKAPSIGTVCLYLYEAQSAAVAPAFAALPAPPVLCKHNADTPRRMAVVCQQMGCKRMERCRVWTRQLTRLSFFQ